MTSNVDLYYNVYKSQLGGEYPIYRGTRYIQYGNGFGDVLRGIFRHVLPVVAHGAAAFFGNLLQNKTQGQDWGAAAKASIVPTAKSVMDVGTSQLSAALGPSAKGSGKRKRVYKEKNYNAHKKKNKVEKDTKVSKLQKFNF